LIFTCNGDSVKLLEISILKTIRFNLRYFGIKGMIHCYALVSKNVKLGQIDGSVKLLNPSTGCLKIGGLQLVYLIRKWNDQSGIIKAQ